MDELDLKIIKILSQNADVTATEIKKIINLSIPAINKRIQNLKQRGYIKKFTIVMDEKKIGKPITAYISVVLKSDDFRPALLEYVQKNDDILECATVTGEYDYFLKVCAESIEQMDEIITDLKQRAGVAKSNTVFSLTNYKSEPTALPSVK